MRYPHYELSWPFWHHYARAEANPPPFGVWRMAYGVWRMAYGVWRMDNGDQRPDGGVNVFGEAADPPQHGAKLFSPPPRRNRYPWTHTKYGVINGYDS
ncbi:hypothetical protein BK025_11090 [Sodalis sp. TME1]|nr:hypothetical protein BK025_11090 [Sodalis sp. TME1]